MPATGLLTAAVAALSLNVWGLPDAGFRVLCPFRTERIEAICRQLKAASARPEGWDVVLLQEVWVHQDRELLKSCGYPYHVDLDDSSKVLDSGTLILSRYPLENADRLTYPSSGDPARSFQDGEAFARKSAIIARMVHPVFGPIWVADTHLISSYVPDDGSGGQDIYADARERQFRQYVAWAIRHTEVTDGKATPLIIGGDWNFGPGVPLWNQVPTLLPGFVAAPGWNDRAGSCTICPPNFMHVENEGKVDHLFASQGAQVRSGGRALTDPEVIVAGETPMNVSDHYGWETVFVFSRPASDSGAGR